ncbi:MAG: HNH endonuclease [Chloroflexi bacterium]|nr:HNH endonuclease [Chloroflexota bacterium]
MSSLGDPSGGAAAGSAGPPTASRTQRPSPSSDSGASSPSPTASSGPVPNGSVPIAALLADLRVAPERRDGYQRSLFEYWIDADGDGCNTRAEVLIAEAASAPTVGEGCAITGGAWVSAYDGLRISASGDLDIDHVVPLAEAWDSGAYAWTASRRRDFANDLGVPYALIAVSASSNRSKGDKDPADWLPPLASDDCPYIGAWIAVKVRWDLSVDERELNALGRLVSGCPSASEIVPIVGPGGAVVPPPPAPSPLPGTTGGSTACDPAYPTVCIAPAPPDLDCGDIPFRRFVVLAPDPHRFDGDNDGVGCES